LTTDRTFIVRTAQNIEEILRHGLVHNLVKHLAEFNAYRLLTKSRFIYARFRFDADRPRQLWIVHEGE